MRSSDTFEGDGSQMLNGRRWIELVTRISGRPPQPATFAWLVEAYSQPDRRYHNVGHIEHCLAEFDGAAGLAESPDEVEFAIWLHDVVYDSKAADNEEKSALLASEILVGGGGTEAKCDRVRDLIFATRHNEPPLTQDARLLVDIDLSILGQPPDVYDIYERNIREEYSWVPVAAYLAGRSDILRNFLNRPRLYFTERFEAMYGLQAKDNLRRAISALEMH
jgi:predicted metal-dependent HD superfamily phosphohydrolase